MKPKFKPGDIIVRNISLLRDKPTIREITHIEGYRYRFIGDTHGLLIAQADENYTLSEVSMVKRIIASYEEKSEDSLAPETHGKKV